MKSMVSAGSEAAASQFVQGARVVIHGKPNLADEAHAVAARDTISRSEPVSSLSQAMIDELRKQLGGRGPVFDADHKLPLPEFPKTIGLICAPQHVRKAMITNVNRWPSAPSWSMRVLFRASNAH